MMYILYDIYSIPLKEIYKTASTCRSRAARCLAGHRRQALKAAYKENIQPLKDEERRLVLELNLARISSVDDIGTTGPL